MRTLMTAAAASTLALAVLCAPAPAKAHGYNDAGRIAGLLDEAERLNMSRPHDEIQVAIAHQIRMLRDRVNDLYSGVRSPAQVVSIMHEGLLAVSQYNDTGRMAAPFIARRTDALVAQMRMALNECGRGGGYGGRYEGRWGGGNPGYGYGYGGYGYAPAPRPAVRDTVPVYAPPTYVPPPAPAYGGHYPRY
jgi:hypothetical protein